MIDDEMVVIEVINEFKETIVTEVIVVVGPKGDVVIIDVEVMVELKVVKLIVTGVVGDVAVDGGVVV